LVVGASVICGYVGGHGPESGGRKATAGARRWTAVGGRWSAAGGRQLETLIMLCKSGLGRGEIDRKDRKVSFIFGIRKTAMAYVPAISRNVDVLSAAARDQA
jgi:hypothetical protein